MTMKIPVDKIGALIGPGGKNVKALCAQYGVTINTEDDGTVTIYGKTGIAAEADGVIVPINLEVLALRGTKNIVVAVAQIQRLMFENNKIVHKGILGLLRSRYVKRYKVQQDFDEIIKDFFPIPAFETIIPSMTSCDKAHAKGWLFAQYDKKAYAVFDELCNELIAKEDALKDLKEPVIIETIGEFRPDREYKSCQHSEDKRCGYADKKTSDIN